MKMDDEKLKRVLQEGIKYDADCIMAEVNRDPSMKDVIAPEDIYENLMKQIHEHENVEESEEQILSDEEKELIRLGKIYKKKRAKRKYIVLIAAVLCALGVGTISFGDGKKMFSEMKRMLGDREQTVVNTDDGDGSVVDEISDEEEAYKKIEETFGFSPVEMYYLPEGMEYSEVAIEQEIQNARLYYVDSNDRMILYYVSTNYRLGSTGIEIEDKLIEEKNKEIEETSVTIQKYLVEDDGSNRWVVSFLYKDAQYSILLHDIKEEEVEKIIENLYFT